jgi:hypothetical protein
MHTACTDASLVCMKMSQSIVAEPLGKACTAPYSLLKSMQGDCHNNHVQRGLLQV